MVSEAKRRGGLAMWAAHPWKAPAARDELVRLYVDERMTQREVAASLNVTPKRIETAMRRFNIPRRPTTPRNQVGAANPRWKGEAAGYQAKHLRVAQLRGKPCECEVCGTAEKTKKYEWANLTGNYDDPNDYQRMCKGCHSAYDAARVVKIERLAELIEALREIMPRLSKDDASRLSEIIAGLSAPFTGKR